MEVIMEESGMWFAKYSEDEVFEIEKSPQYTKSLRQKGVKICEFVLRRGNKIYFMEAKSSCPRQIVWDNPKEDREQRKRKYEEYIEEIVLKMRHSLSLYGNILLKRYSQNGISEKLLNTDLSNVLINLVLIINTFVVLNKEMAKKKGFII